jgi:hypothetical protein
MRSADILEDLKMMLTKTSRDTHPVYVNSSNAKRHPSSHRDVDTIIIGFGCSLLDD